MAELWLQRKEEGGHLWLARKQFMVQASSSSVARVIHAEHACRLYIGHILRNDQFSGILILI